MKDMWVEPETKKINKKKLAIVITIVILLILFIVTIVLYNVIPDFRNWADVKILNKEIYQDSAVTIDLPSENSKVFAFGSNIGIINKNKLDIYSNNGNKSETLDIEINNPLFCSSGRYAVIAEKGGQKIYSIENKKILWDKQIEGDIAQIHINKNGYVAAVISGTVDKTVLAVFDNNGNNLFNLYLSNSRLADVCISNDNKALALAEIDTAGTMIQSNIKVISVENPKNTEEKIYKGKANSLITNIKYQDNNDLVCMYDDSIHIIKDEKDEVLLDYNNEKTTFNSIEVANKIVNVKEESTGMFSADSIVTIIDTSSREKKNYNVDAVTKEIYTFENVIALNLGTEIEFLSTDGWLLKRYIAKQEITNLVISNSIAGIVYRDKIAIVNL